MIDGARPSEMPGFIKPQLASLRSKAPAGDKWLHEIKYDGYRIQIHLNGGRRKVYTRNGLDWTKRFSVIAGALDLPGQAIIDGEVVVIQDGRTNFSELQAELAKGDQDRLAFYAFDLLYLNGLDLRRSPQIQRKRVLKELLDGLEGPSLYSDHLVGDGQQLDTIVSPKSKLTKPIRAPKATWVEPAFTVEVEYRDITAEGLLRAASFKGLSKRA